MVDPPNPFGAAILCGGSSRRMGRDKALMPYDGTAMANRVADAAAAAGAARVIAVGGDREGLEALGLAYCADRWPGQGPLGGVITALGHLAEVTDVAVLACDLLRPDSSLLTELVQRRRSADADAVFAVEDGRIQWTYGVWHPRAAATLEAQFGAGVRSLHDATAALARATIEVHGGSTADADRPEDLPGHTRRLYP